MEHALLDKPVSQCVTYTDYAMPRVPSISVAAGSNIFIYRHIRPYRKWTCPPVEISQLELNVSSHSSALSNLLLDVLYFFQLWEDLRSGNISPSDGAAQLCEARDTGSMLSSHSLDFIILEV